MAPTLQPQKQTALPAGTVLIVLGLVTYLLSRGRDGFDKGLFTGATVAFMVLGAYLLGSTFRRTADDPNDRTTDTNGDSDDDLWLPSRDEH
ncbi:hypothetical protein [Knoellia subterranea]|uniref:Uncharacterized protein n=1 Tax=Knoellia subterranea KCTC 19937 TaxID=1385521 RepID=A0A0A0JK06_9MICO|nr:hypothetical protein [Knoellia subterranea]KGN37064.1 hypothetical protein N803_16745 [Knoellia subterranea KCTC 19937]